MKATTLYLDLSNAVDVARRFRDATRPNLIRQNAIWYDYTGTHYAEVEDDTIKSTMQAWMSTALEGKLMPDGTMRVGKKPLQLQPYDVRHAVEALENLVHKPAETYKSPCWLNGGETGRLIPCLNGLLDLDVTPRVLRPHTPEFFCTYCLDLEYRPEVQPPQRWLDFLNETFKGRQHLTDALQEAFGYIISGDRSQEKIFYHIGRVRSGKGVVQTVSRHLVGDDNAVSFSFGGNESTLGDKHGLAGAENALLIQIPDISVGPRASPAATTRLKEIAGGDRVPVRPLFAKATSMVLPGQVQCGSNGIPNFGADADALAARLLFWPHDNHVPADKRDTTLKDKRKSPLLQVEALTGILNWSLAGLDRLRKRGYFEEWPESLDIKRIMIEESNQIAAFIGGDCELDPSGEQAARGPKGVVRVVRVKVNNLFSVGWFRSRAKGCRVSP